MGSSDTSAAQRARTKTPDFSELFRSAHGSRHASRTGAGNGSSPSLIPCQGEKATVMKAPSRRSMLPFLGRKKPAEQPAVPAPPLSRKSVSNAAYPITPVNTVRRSFGNGHAVLMITPSPNGVPAEPPLPSKLPSMDAHSPSLGSKLAAHFTPLRSPSRNSKVRSSMIQKPDAPIPPVPSSPALSPPVPQIRAPSIESQHSSMRSRSTTPRPLRGPHLRPAENGDEEDFSDLFTLPDQLKKPHQSPKAASTTSVHILGDSPKKSGELTPTTPVTPLGPPLHFPIPPSTIIPRSILTEKRFSRYSSEGARSLSSRGSGSPSKRLPSGAGDRGSGRPLHSDVSSQDERQSNHRRTTSVSGSDTDTSRAYDSTYSASSFKLSKPSRTKPKPSASTVTKTSSGPPPSVPLPTPPLTPNPGCLVPRSVPATPPNRVALPRPRANTLSVTSNLVVPGCAVPKSSNSSPTRSSRANSSVTPDATIEELQDALSQQRRKNAQLQEYVGTITKRYEDDRMAMTRTIEKLERSIRKKMREIEGLRWLVIHNGAVSDIDAAANLARSSLSTQDGDGFDSVQRRSPLSSSPVAPPHHDGSPSHQSMPGQKGEGITVTATTAPEFRSNTSPFSTSSVSETTSLTTLSLSVIPERIDGISRAERQKLKEERRASKALRRISAASSFALGTDPLTQPSPVGSPIDPNFDPQQGMDEVLEKLQPFRHT